LTKDYEKGNNFIKPDKTMRKGEVLMINEFRSEFKWLSNFWLSPVVFDGLIFPSTENAFQAAKSFNRHTRKGFCLISPKEAKKLGRVIQLRGDWDDVKLDIMLEVNQNKFVKGGYLAEKLIATGNQQLIEGNTWGDIYWGVNIKTGVGANNLGRILMRIRKGLQNNG